MRSRSFSHVAVALVALLALPANAREKHPAEIERATSAPYTGDLAIFEDPNRDRNLQVDRVMDLLGIKPGSSVADIGAGSGWFSVRAARRVGESGTVFAVEINDDYLRYIADRVKREGLPNVRMVRGLPDDPRLPTDGVDAVLMLKTYHEIARPLALLRRTRGAMKAGARLGIIDRNGNGNDHGLNRAIVIRELASVGFKLVGDYDFVKGDGDDYFLVFERHAGFKKSRAH